MLEVDPDPFQQFDRWFHDACQTMPDHLVNSTVLSTVSSDHKPSARIVLLKEFGPNGFVFYTNYNSRKGKELTVNPSVALLFWWEALERQVRIEGVAEKVSEQQSKQYFQSRPKSSQLAALVSQQSQILEDAEELQKKYKKLAAQYANAESVVHRPDYWGGYLIKPTSFEYWQGGENRLHDRFLYVRNVNGDWTHHRLFP